MNPITLKVTKSIINEASKRDSKHCMIADAIKYQIPDARYIIVDLQSIRFTSKKKGKRFIYLTPPSAQKAIINFDQGKEINPLSFTISQGYAKTIENRANWKTFPKKNENSSVAKKKSSPKVKVKMLPEREFGIRKFKA